MVIERERLAEALASKRKQGQRIIFTNGVFDLLHLGHLRYLRNARRLGDLLVVGVNSDESARHLKGPRRPLVPDAERAELLAALDCVDYVTIFGERTAEATLALLRPDIYVKGADYAARAKRQQNTVLDAQELHRALADDAGLGGRLPEALTVADYGGSLALLAYLPGHSTSDLIDRIVARYGSDADARP